MACVYERKALKAKESIVSNETVSVVDSIFADEESCNQGFHESPRPPAPRRVEGISLQIVEESCDFTDDNHSHALSSTSSDLTHTGVVLSTPSTASSVVNSVTSLSTDLDFSLDSIGHEAGFESDMMLNFYPFNADFPTSYTFYHDTTSIDSSVAFFDSPYLKLTYLTALHRSASQSSAVTRQFSPFTPTSRPGGSQFGQRFLLQNIRSYPRMMVEPNNPPPFIHQCALHDESDEESPQFPYRRPESLAVCRTIMHMYSIKMKQTSSFIWRTVEVEQKGLRELVRGHPHASNVCINASVAQGI
jgi:hypothetical protein